MKFTPKCYLMTPALDKSISFELITTNNMLNDIMLKELPKRCPWISLVEVSPTDAYLILIELGGAGIGCMVQEPRIALGARELAWIARSKLNLLKGLLRGLKPQSLVLIKEPAIKPMADRVSKELLTVQY